MKQTNQKAPNNKTDQSVESISGFSFPTGQSDYDHNQSVQSMSICKSMVSQQPIKTVYANQYAKNDHQLNNHYNRELEYIYSVKATTTTKGE